MRKDVEDALQCRNVAVGRLDCAEFKSAEFEGEAEFCQGCVAVDPQEFVQRGLPVPSTVAIANVEIVPQCLGRQVDG